LSSKQVHTERASRGDHLVRHIAHFDSLLDGLFRLSAHFLGLLLQGLGPFLQILHRLQRFRTKSGKLAGTEVEYFATF
jgi:hypothetical protein